MQSLGERDIEATWFKGEGRDSGHEKKERSHNHSLRACLVTDCGTNWDTPTMLFTHLSAEIGPFLPD